MFLYIDKVRELVGDDVAEGELLVMALRRRILEGKVTRRDLLKIRGFGSKGLRALLEFLEIKEALVSTN